MNSIKILAALVLFTAGTNCREPDDEDGIVGRDTCAKVCSLIVCDGTTEVDENYVSECADRCMDKGDDATSVGQQCADAFVRSVNCFGRLDCADYLRWENGDGTICDAELTGFTESCPGMTFDFRE